jgi:YVTN family beta-propeller protein
MKKVLYRHKHWLQGSLGCATLLAGLTACVDPVVPPAESAILTRASKSGAIAMSGDNRYVVQVNPENDSITVIKLLDNSKRSELTVGNEPVSVVIHPDNKTAFVANRADGTIMKISGIDTDNPTVSGTVQVGSEPTGIALSPRGDKLVVAEFAEGRVASINTTSMTVTNFTNIPNPRALAITNNFDQSDADEKVVVTQFYGRITGKEATDNSRSGVVHVFNLEGLGKVGEVVFDNINPGDFAPTNSAAPNQLASIAISGDKFFATAVASAPDGVPSFNQNVFPFVLIGKISTASKIATISLADAIKKQVASPPETKNFMADLYDIDVIGENTLYLLGRGADAVQRAILDTATNTLTLGKNDVTNKQVELLEVNDAAGAKIGCQNPIGLVVPVDLSKNKNMYVNCWVSRTTTVVDLVKQVASTKIAATIAPAAGADADINKGRRDYFTARARWSKESWSSCGSCHPDGLSDNMTWSFPSGPRQSTSMDGTFSHGAGTQKQRILNWTGIFDEIHDFERNTRTVSGGLGAVVTGDLSSLAAQTVINLNPDLTDDKNGLKVNLGIPVKVLQDETPSIVKDFDSIEAFVKTFRPPSAKRFSSAASVANGLAVFQAGNCQSCHGGAGWTVSRRFFTPSKQNNIDIAALDVTGAGFGIQTKMIQAEQNGGTGIGPAQMACVLRKVDTFGALDPADNPTLETKQDETGAQGNFSGYNVPSLYGLSVGAPYLHHGQAKTLTELFTDARWGKHLTAGNANFTLSGTDKVNLENFLFSIDAKTPEIALPAQADKCPTTFN